MTDIQPLADGAAFTAAKIGDLVLRNRLLLAPMVTILAGVNYDVTEALIEHYRYMASSGIGGVIVESTLVNDRDETMHLNELKLSSRRCLPGFCLLAEAISDERSRPILQLNSHDHYSPEMPIAEIRRVVKEFGAAAGLAKEAGFRAIELHSCHNNFLCDIINPRTNGRSDLFGGGVRGWTRFDAEVIAAVKAEAGNSFPIIVRINGSDFAEGGITPSIACEIAAALQEAGADAIHVTGGLARDGLKYITPDVSFAPAWLIRTVASQIKSAIQIPVIGVSRVDSIELANDVVAGGHADFVALGRALLADPEMIRERRKSKCIWCNNCTKRVVANKPIRCAINKRLGRTHLKGAVS